MKRLTALILALFLSFSLAGCAVDSAESGEKYNDLLLEPVTLSDGRTVYSKEPFVEFPQTGEYKETALLTNVPGQGVPLLLDMREDGTIDYIFADVENKADFQNFASSGARYFTIAPDGTATEQDTEWMDGIDEYMAITLETTQDPNGKWRFLFTAEEDTILILGQYHNVVQPMLAQEHPDTRGRFLYSTLFKIVDGKVTIVPLEWEVDIGTKILDLRSQYISRVKLENGQITLYKRDVLFQEEPYENLCTVIYNMDGTVIQAKALYNEDVYPMFYWDDTGIYVDSMDYVTFSNSSFPGSEKPQIRYESPYVGDYWRNRDGDYGPFSNGWYLPLSFNPYDENDPLSYSLYYHGRHLDNIEAVVQGSGRDYCCWYDEAGTGLLMRYTYHPEGKIEPEVVTVWTMETHSKIQSAIAQWNATHASPVFVLEYAAYEVQESHLTMEDIITRLNLDLLNNRGPDVLVLDGLNVDKYMEFMVPLDMPSTEDIYESIKTRFTQGDDLLAVPLRVSPYLLGRAAEDTVEITSLQQFADVVEENTKITGQINGRNNIDIWTCPYKVGTYYDVFLQWYPAWAEAIWEGGKLNKEVLVEFLTQTTRLVDVYGLTEGNRYWGDPDSNPGYEYSSYLMSTDGTKDGKLEVKSDTTYPYILAAPNHVGLYGYWHYANEDMENQKPDPHYLSSIPGPDGTGAMLPITIVGVRAGGNEAAGKAFVELLLSRQMQLGKAWHHPGQADGYPITWEYTEELLNRMEDYINQEYAVQNDYEDVMNSLRTVVIDKFLHLYVYNAAYCCYRVEDRLTPEQAAEDLYEATRIYLAELR